MPAYAETPGTANVHKWCAKTVFLCCSVNWRLQGLYSVECIKMQKLIGENQVFASFILKKGVKCLTVLFGGFLGCIWSTVPHFRVPVQERYSYSGAALAQPPGCWWGLECAQGAALNTGLIQQVESTRKRARGDPTAACNCSVCGNRGDRAGLCAWQQDRRWWT